MTSQCICAYMHMCIWIIRPTPASNLPHTELIASMYLGIIRSPNSLSPDRRQTIIWNNADVLSMKHLGKKSMKQFYSKKIHMLMESAKWWPCSSRLNVSTATIFMTVYVRNWRLSLRWNSSHAMHKHNYDQHFSVAGLHLERQEPNL